MLKKRTSEINLFQSEYIKQYTYINIGTFCYPSCQLFSRETHSTEKSSSIATNEHKNHTSLQYRSKISGPKCMCKTCLHVKHACACIFDTRMKYAHKAKLISMYELAYCWPIVVILLLVFIAFYCIHAYGNGY